MNKEIVEKYLTEKCGITPGPWETDGNVVYDYVYVIQPNEEGIIAECPNYCHRDRWQEEVGNARVISAAFSMLRDWILTAWELFFRTTGNGFEGVEFDIFQRAIKNIESALNKKWDVIKKELEEMV